MKRSLRIGIVFAVAVLFVVAIVLFNRGDEQSFQPGAKVNSLQIAASGKGQLVKEGEGMSLFVENGDVSVGERVYVVVNADHEIQTVRARDASGQDVPIEGDGNIYYYQKPEGDVTVEVQVDEDIPAAYSVYIEDISTAAGDIAVALRLSASEPRWFGSFEAIVTYDATTFVLKDVALADARYAVNQDGVPGQIKIAYAGDAIATDEGGVELALLTFSSQGQAKSTAIQVAAASVATTGTHAYASTSIGPSLSVDVSN